MVVKLVLNQEGQCQPVGASSSCCPQVVWILQRCFRLRLANARIAMSIQMPQLRLWRNLNSTRPCHSFGSLGRVFAKRKKFLSLTVAVDPSLYILYVILSPVNPDICVDKVSEASIRRSSISCLCLDVPDQCQWWLILPMCHTCNHDAHGG